MLNIHIKINKIICTFFLTLTKYAKYAFSIFELAIEPIVRISSSIWYESRAYRTLFN